MERNGGAILYHRPYLTTACPAEAEGSDGSIMPAGNIVWKHFRVEGMHIVICFAYFVHSIGLQGPNLELIQKINDLREGGRRQVVVCDDFHMKLEI